MKNAFFITACRFHTKDNNKLLIIGYFRNNEMKEHRPLIMMDNEALSYVSREKQLTPPFFKEIEGQKITKEYYFWIQLPETWMEYRQLRIFNCYEEEKELITSIRCEKLLQYRMMIPKSIDSVTVSQDGFVIQGWYIDNGNTSVRLYDMNGNSLPVEISYGNRKDVLTAYPENEQQEIVGFTATYEGTAHRKVRVHFETIEKQTDETLKLIEFPIEKAAAKSREMISKAIVYYRQFGMKATLIRTVDKLANREYTDYEQWLRMHQPSKGVLRKQRKQKFPYMPKISIVVPLYRTPERYLSELIDSIREQSYENWELCLSDGSGENSPLTDTLEAYAKKDKRIRVVHNDRQLHISDNTNEALKSCTGDCIAFADHDDLLTRDALFECVRVMNEYPETELIYSDEDKINMEGTEYFQPHFKSDYSLDLLRTNNYFCHLVVVKRELYEKVGLLDPMCDGAQDYDFVLRCAEQTSNIRHIAKILYHWRAHKDSTAGNPESKPYITKAGVRAVQGHYDRLGIRATVTPTRHIGIYRSKFEVTDRPLISVIIPNKDHVADLDKCIRSVEKSTYTNIEYIIVENNSQEEQTFAYYEKLEQSNEKVKVVYWDGKGFNYPAINNYGVKQAKGDYLLFLNNDTEMLNSDCIEELFMYCMRDDVGAVGAKMYYEDGTIQHAGVIVGLGGVAGHAFLGCPHDFPGYCCRADVPQNLSAVTAACMLMKRKVFEEVGGFDEGYAVSFNDVDLCLKVREAGYLIVYNPYAELMHFESKSRGYEDTEEKIQRSISEILLFQERWKDFLKAGDPYYNPNLTLDRNDFSMNLTMNKKE